jgi:anthranilate synthase/aminodeoxychorismate synthase-like glutamine amidotransferase
MIVIIDNYDSFTYNLYQYVGQINPDVKVYRNDAITLEALEAMDISHIIISPGPGFPNESGISKKVIEALGPKIPVLGVCLGHQAIAEVYGGSIVHAVKPVHGKTSLIHHDEENLFQGLSNPLVGMRYHSLLLKQDEVPESLLVTAISPEGEIMGIKHKDYPIFGLQFHPESIATECGMDIIRNFLRIERRA